LVKVLKIGGSILTDKSRRLIARSEEINRVAEEVAPYAENLILIHGAGSFGHVQAEEYNLRKIFNPEGLRMTHSSVVELNRMVVDALTRSGANPMPVHPFSCVTLRDGRIESFSLEPIEQMIEEGLLPVLHGDVAMDITRRAGIVSGDDLVPYIARSLGAEIVAEGTDKDGVLVEGKPIKRISWDDWSAVEEHLGGSSNTDVTGGMREKVLKLLELTDAGIDSLIFNASKRGHISRVLLGEALGTKVERRN
jgi:isopentenyl phosphate kinase